MTQFVVESQIQGWPLKSTRLVLLLSQSMIIVYGHWQSNFNFNFKMLASSIFNFLYWTNYKCFSSFFFNLSKYKFINCYLGNSYYYRLMVLVDAWDYVLSSSVITPCFDFLFPEDASHERQMPYNFSSFAE